MKILAIICLLELILPNNNGNKEQIEYEEICIKCTQLWTDEYVINNNNDYQQLLENRSPHPDCSTYKLPEIDFNRYTLIIIHYGVSGCKHPDMNFHIFKNNCNYFVKTEIVQYGLRKRLNYITKKVLISKIDDVVEVKFKKNVIIKDKYLR